MRASQRNLENVAFFKAMASFAKKKPKTPDLCLILRWAIRGGGERFCIKICEAYRSAYPKANITVIFTDGGADPKNMLWRTQFERFADVVTVHEELNSVSYPLRSQLLLQFTKTLNAKNLLIGFSEDGWRMLALYGHEIRARKRMLIEFCSAKRKSRKQKGYVETYFGDAKKNTDLFLTDNFAYPSELSEKFGFKKFKILPTPIVGGKALLKSSKKARLSREIIRKKNTKLTVLWASRLDTQKRVDLLLQIASHCPQYQFGVYGSPTVEEKTQKIIAQLSRLPNVRMLGGFDRFSDIPTQNYDVFLYTSSWDGRPTVLMEAMNAGLPVIAPPIGGITEFVSSKNGWVAGDLPEYLNALELAHNSAQRKKKGQEGAKLIQTQFNFRRFSKEILKELKKP